MAAPMTDAKRHWETVYTTKGERDVSWFEAVPSVSLEMIEAAVPTTQSCILDVGGGDSRLIDVLLARGCACLAVLDVSAAALQRARVRLGELASSVTWIEADVVSDWSVKPMDVWHDRAVFHFLTNPDDRMRYQAHVPADTESRRHGHHRHVRARRPNVLHRTARGALLAGVAGR